MKEVSLQPDYWSAGNQNFMPTLRALEQLANLPQSPKDFTARLPRHLRPKLHRDIGAARQWVNELHELLAASAATAPSRESAKTEKPEQLPLPFD